LTKTRVPETRLALVRELQAWAVRTEIKTLDYHEKSLNACTTALMQTVLKAKGSMQWAWLRIHRALSTLDASLAVLAPRINYPKVVRRYFAQAQTRARGAVLTPSEALDRLTALAPLLDRLPEYVRLLTAETRAFAFPFQESRWVNANR
jgi:ubiquinone biosynthesis protein